VTPRDRRFDPAEIGPTDDEQRLRIRWEDGAVHEYEPRELRLLCPCAACVDETTGVRTLRPEMVDQDVYPTAIHYVGRYALQCVWSDGHSTGIYTYEYLRELGEEG
jgi:ATP-binding protein involved in chromosome partitioning